MQQTIFQRARFRFLKLAAAGALLAILGQSNPDVWGQIAPAIAAKPDAKLPDVFHKAAPEGIEDLRAVEQHVQQLVRKVMPATVNVQIGMGQGSGVIVSSDGYVLTAAHVVGKPGRSALLTLADGRTVRGRTLGVDSTRDAALMKITTAGEYPFAEMGADERVDVGDWCLVLGHPGGYQSGRPPVVRLGRVVHKRQTLLQSDCTLVGGDSGGPMFDMHGRVVGIHSRIGASATWNFHIPISAFSNNWERLVSAEAWGEVEQETAFLGIGGADHDQGCLVTAVGEGLPADEAGLQAGDVIVQFDGKRIRNFEELQQAVAAKKPGEEVTLVFLRGSERLEKSAVLTTRP